MFLKDYLNKICEVFLKVGVFQKADSTKERFKRVSFLLELFAPSEAKVEWNLFVPCRVRSSGLKSEDTPHKNREDVQIKNNQKN